MKRTVGVMIESTWSYGWEIIRGVAKYNRDHDRWSLMFTPRNSGDPLPRWLKNWRGDGILARVLDARSASALLSVGCPVVGVGPMVSGMEIPSVQLDSRQSAHTVFIHLFERGFRRFGYFGRTPSQDFPEDARLGLFRRLSEEAGCPCDVFELPQRNWPLVWSERRERQIAAWLDSLKKPVGVMTLTDLYAAELLNACHACGASVPDQVAVVGVGNDRCLCEITMPTMSSVDVNGYRFGYESAALLDRIMNGTSRPNETILLPSTVVMRQSSDVLATDDKKVLEAVRFIRANAFGPLNTKDVLRNAKMSRTALEPRIKGVLGRTIHQEIHRLRIERIKELLVTSDAPIKEIAFKTGFRHVEYMTRAFRQATGRTPTAYRKESN